LIDEFAYTPDYGASGSADGIHDAKRLLSFDFLDQFLTGCATGKCPDLQLHHLQFLIDISVKGYAKQRAYRMWESGQGDDASSRYFASLNRAKTVLRCQIDPSFSDEVFRADEEQLASSPEHREAAKRRKAYWRYMDREGREGPLSDYYREDFCDACNFLSSFPGRSPIPVSPPDPQDWETNFDIVNGLDLYRFCLCRKRWSRY
jgi:hypothetical protein